MNYSRPTPAEIRREWLKCSASAVYFIENYVQIESPERRAWVPFHLWPAQREALVTMARARRLYVLKARQLGLTWLSVSYALWLMLFRPPAVILLFSLREAEAQLLAKRLRGIYAHLPPWLRCRAVVEESAATWALSNGSRAHAFSTRAGRSYTGTLALVDEADFVPNLAEFLNAVKPTVDGGGQLLCVSTADKAQPLSPFKRLFRAAGSGHAESAALFLPWSARPDRSHAWYERVRSEMRAQRGSDDDLFQEYPATAEEALRVRSLAARLPVAWIEAVTCEALPLPAVSLPEGAPPGTLFFMLPRAGRLYVAGADPAEGNPHSDESVATVLDAESGEQVALLAGALAPDRFAALCAELCAFYNHAPLLVERNNHGHAVLGWLRMLGVELLRGSDGREGWLSTASSKTRLYDEGARQLQAGHTQIHDGETAAQLASVDALTLRAPLGLHDDRAMAFVLALAALNGAQGLARSAALPPVDVLGEYDRGRF